MRQEVPEPDSGRVSRVEIRTCRFSGVNGGDCTLDGGAEAIETGGVEAETGIETSRAVRAGEGGQEEE